MRRLILSVLFSISAIAFVAAQGPAVHLEQRTGSAKIVQVYPNPTVEFIHVKFEDVKVENVKLTLYNIIGNEMNVEREVISEHELRLRVKDLSSGYYLLAIKDEESGLRQIHKVLKK